MKYSINIENPCNQNYNLMKDNYAGKFCSVCEKSVIDFSKSSDDEIDTILKRYNYQVCAKFRKDQLNKPLNLPKQRTYFSSFLKILSGLMLFGATEKVVANTDKPNTFKSIFNEDFRNRINENRLIVKNDTLKTIKGNVISAEDGLPLPMTLIVIKGTEIGTSTDIDGNFELKIPEYLHNNDFIEIEVSYIAYTTQTVQINLNQITDSKRIILNSEEIESIIIGYPVKKRK